MKNVWILKMFSKFLSKKISNQTIQQRSSNSDGDNNTLL